MSPILAKGKTKTEYLCNVFVRCETWCLQRGDTNLTLLSVSLYDSLDDTGGEDMRKDTAASVDRGNTRTMNKNPTNKMPTQVIEKSIYIHITKIS